MWQQWASKGESILSRLYRLTGE